MQSCQSDPTFAVSIDAGWQGHLTCIRSCTQEWITPQPSRRPDIFPEFDKQSTPMPKPMPGDPELPDEEVTSSTAASDFACLTSSTVPSWTRGFKHHLLLMPAAEAKVTLLAMLTSYNAIKPKPLPEHVRRAAMHAGLSLHDDLQAECWYAL